MESKVFVYILELSHGKHYTGITNNIFKRVTEHDNGKSKYTSHFKVLNLIYLSLHDNRSIARKEEVKIKRMGAKKAVTLAKLKNKKQIRIQINDIKYLDEKTPQLMQLLIIKKHYTNIS